MLKITPYYKDTTFIFGDCVYKKIMIIVEFELRYLYKAVLCDGQMYNCKDE